MSVASFARSPSAAAIEGRSEDAVPAQPPALLDAKPAGFRFCDAVQQYLFQFSDVLPVGRRITGLLKLLKRDTKGFEGFSGRTRGHENGHIIAVRCIFGDQLMARFFARNNWHFQGIIRSTCSRSRRDFRLPSNLVSRLHVVHENSAQLQVGPVELLGQGRIAGARQAPQAARSSPVSPDRPPGTIPSGSMSRPLGRTRKRITTAPFLRIGGFTSSGISGSQVRWVSRCHRNNHELKSTPCWSENLHTTRARARVHRQPSARSRVRFCAWPGTSSAHRLLQLVCGVRRAHGKVGPRRNRLRVAAPRPAAAPVQLWESDSSAPVGGGWSAATRPRGEAVPACSGLRGSSCRHVGCFSGTGFTGTLGCSFLIKSGGKSR